MDRVYRIYGSHDTEYTITSNKLIDDFINECGKYEDADTIGWLMSLRDTDRQEEAVEYITELLEIDLEEI